MARLRRGEVRWYQFRRPDKKRPIVILTRDSALDFLGEITIAPITSTVRDIPSEVLLTTQDGMARDCAINLDHVQTVPKRKVGSLVTTLSREKLDRIKVALSFALGL